MPGAMLHFAYGSNMDAAAMRRRCPGAEPLGTARLHNWRFVVTRDGYASVTPSLGQVVHGVLWRLGPRDLAAVNVYEAVDSGLYRRRMLTVRHNGGCVQALVYVGRENSLGRPRPGYQDTILTAAREWRLPQDYVRALERWKPARGASSARATEAGESA